MTVYINTTQKIILRYLFIGWLLLSLLLSATVFYYKLETLDHRLLEQAVSDSRIFSTEHDWEDAKQIELLKQRANTLIKNSFVLIELYDQKKKEMLRVSRLETAFEKKLSLKADSSIFPLPNRIITRHSTFLVDSEIYVQVVVPLINKNGEMSGHFEGIFQVDAATKRNIEYEIAATLFVVFIVTLFITSIFYPFILFLNRRVRKLSTDLLRSNIELLKVLGSAIAKRDSDTSSHNFRVTIYAIRLAEARKLPIEQIRNLIIGAFLHDVGKIGIKDSILLKPAKLSEEEFAVMRNHVPLGVDIINNSHWLKGAQDVVEFHHEKFDGNGYMKGLKGKDIPLNARIFAIVDVFDALTSKRPYKKAFSFDEAIETLHRGSGSHFDPELLQAFNEIASKLYQEFGHEDDKALSELLTRMASHAFVNSI